jgi:A1 cistron-splicing factor AAR2
MIHKSFMPTSLSDIFVCLCPLSANPIQAEWLFFHSTETGTAVFAVPSEGYSVLVEPHLTIRGVKDLGTSIPMDPIYKQLVNHIEPTTIGKIMPEAQESRPECRVFRLCGSETHSYHSDKLFTLQRPGMQVFSRLSFTPIDLKHSFPENTVGAERSKYFLDKSFLLERLIREQWLNQEEALGEMQLCFLLLLSIHVFDAFEQWKAIVTLLCQCKEALRKRTSLYVEFCLSLRHQLSLCDKEFFSDDLLATDFLFENVLKLTENASEMDPLPIDLLLELESLLEYCNELFGWDMSVKRVCELEEEETGEDAPVICHFNN